MGDGEIVSNDSGCPQSSAKGVLGMIRRGSVKSITERLQLQVSQEGWGLKMSKAKTGIALPIFGKALGRTTEETTSAFSKKISTSSMSSGEYITTSVLCSERKTSIERSSVTSIPSVPCEEDETSSSSSEEGSNLSVSSDEASNTSVPYVDGQTPSTPSSVASIPSMPIKERIPPSMANDKEFQTLSLQSKDASAAPVPKPRTKVFLEDQLPKRLVPDYELPPQNVEEDSTILLEKSNKCEEENEQNVTRNIRTPQDDIHRLETIINDLLARIEKQQSELEEISKISLGLEMFHNKQKDVMKHMTGALESIIARIEKLEKKCQDSLD